MTLSLTKPDVGKQQAFVAMLNDYATAGERFRHAQLHTVVRRDFSAYVRQLDENARGVNLHAGWVPHNMFWLMDNEVIVGETTLRHYLVPALVHEGGHIGYRITPSRRRRGNGKGLLALMLDKARGRGLPQVLVTCDSDNIGSAKIIESNGGVYESEVISHNSHKPVSRYWITLDETLANDDWPQPMLQERKMLDKVVIFVTHGHDLLLFEHPTAGVQVPAGTVEPDEAYSNAAFRELFEETGLTQVRLNRYLGSIEYELADERRFVLKTELLTQRPGGHSLSGRLNRGIPVRIINRKGAYAEVIQEEVDHRQSPAAVRVVRSGWILERHLAPFLTRRFYHIELQGQRIEQWQHNADGHRFRCHWASLLSRPRLVTGQDQWLTAFYDDLLGLVS